MHVPVVSKTLIPSHSVVECASERAHYWAELLRLWGVRGRRATSTTFHPGCNPRSLSRPLAPRLQSGDYHICLKSDGVRYVLLLTTRRGDPDAAVALMIDRSRNMYEVEVVAPEEHFRRGTVLEGELVWKQPDERVMIYYVFDAVVVRGDRVDHRPFRERLHLATQLVRLSDEIRDARDLDQRALETDSIVLVHFDPRVELRPKHFVERRHAERLWSERNDAEHRVDGIIVQSMDAPYTMGTAEDDSVFKWKDHSTIDLAGPALRCADAPLPPTVAGRRIEVLESRVVPTCDADVVEYHVDADDERVALMAIRMRPDKTSANGRRVVEATVHDVLNQIQPADLAA